MKHYKAYAAGLAALMTVAASGMSAIAAQGGDLNNDGLVNAQDTGLIVDFLLGRQNNISADADLNSDGKINAKDLSLMKGDILNPQVQPPSGLTPSGFADLGTAPHANATMFSDFRTGDPGDFFASDGWTNGNPFDCGWYKENTKLEEACLKLTIDKDPKGKYNYSGAEYRTNEFYGYGYYETSMQAIKNDGVVSSFFTYTGPSDDNPWDEIDIEILGKDTTKVQFNYYTSGQGNHEFMYDLGFDASEAYHTYGFDWEPDYIAWFVDGKEVYRATANIPVTKGKIMMNTWPGTGVDDWLKPYNGNTPLTARYQWVTYEKSAAADSQGQDPHQNPDPQPGGNIPDLGTKPDTTADMFSNFAAGDAGDFFASDGWTNGDPFDCGWYKENTKIADGYLSLTIDKDPTGKYHYSGAEYRTNSFYHYGYYETSMQAIKNDGVVSSFFTYTGPSDVINGQKNPWDEIDIEILGKDTTKVQFNYYTNGQGNHEFMYDLGFDSSLAFHTYGFDWQPDHIAWFVDGKEVYRATANIPVTPGKIMMNTWPGTGVDGWLKHYDGNTPLTARYQWVTYKKSGNSGQNPDPNPPSGLTPSGFADLGTAMNSSAKMVSDFRTGSAGDFFASDGWSNGNPFDCGWYKGNTKISDGCLQLTIDRDYSGKYHYSGAEYRTNKFYHFGYYETSMQAIKNDGVVSSFFTYTGPSDVINGQKNPWDEIDIEILGKDTTKVQFNYYTSGQGNHEFMYDLGFDSSEAFHTYGFDWQPDHIAWFVDGKEVYRATANIPQTPGKIMMNTWPGTGVDEWLKHYDGRTPLTARYQWVTFN